MLNEEPTRAGDFDLACVSETVAAGLVARWATDADRAYAAGRVRSGMALAALRALLFRATGRRDWVVVRAESGKPSVRMADGRDGPSVSVSHTAGLIAVAVARDVAVGMDVECHRSRDFSALADEAFGAAERREVAIGGAAAFYRIWTLREAVAKATGDGLALVLNRADLADGVASGRADVRGRWTLLHVLPEPGYSLGVAWLGGRPGLVPRRVELG
jgi:4'-phosphopantetheinyl transferase